ncbi:hypothetical protein EVAR_14191_1 [Eumeta japonica]|uniref:RNase H type-1 domain-containing protein n=1 Tax=Eumeta variegata TaxID=151549 RepID=A0A4C1UEQ1_EUMVA|nr:hypothetical protein EVAR_14191_1 [Eumeta japonica]
MGLSFPVPEPRFRSIWRQFAKEATSPSWTTDLPDGTGVPDPPQVSWYSALFLTKKVILDIRVRETAWLYEVKRDKELEDTFINWQLKKPVYFGNLSHPAYVPEIGYERVYDLESQTMTVRAHPGILGNERADELARQAALTKKTAADYEGFPLSYAKKVIRAASLKSGSNVTLREAWVKSPNASFPGWKKLKKPDWYSILRQKRMTSQIAQALMGHRGFTQYLFRFRLRHSPH